MTRLSRCLPLVLPALLAWVGALPASAAAWSPAPIAQERTRGGLDPFAESMRAGATALEAGRGEEALHHFQFALTRCPGVDQRFAVLAKLVESAAVAQDANAQWLWAEALIAAAADERGRWKPDRELLAFLPDGGTGAMKELADARADAVQALLRFRDQQQKSKKPGAPLAAEWAEDLARSILKDAEATTMLAKWHDKVPPDLSVPWSVQDKVLDGLEEVIRKAQANGDTALVIRAARCLRGLTSQANFDKLQGPRPPGLGGAASLANDALSRARREQMESGATPWTVEALDDLDEDERREFTLKHASFANPGVAHSPRDWYRLETNCGFGTLLGAAETVELHHQRLANWYGTDPFVGRQGIVRVVPESYGLEEEGAGFWWVGGFQGGDVTTLKFTMSTIPSLGRGLTHELTHRFDGAIYPGQPACFAEGRAVWTGGSYGHMDDEEFVEDYVNFGTMRAVRRKGYSEKEELINLLDGEIEDYRDNYSAGYALFVFLRSWTGLEPAEEGAVDVDGIPLGPTAKEGPPIFAEQMEAFLKGSARGKGKASVRFAKFMADGKDGRPADMEAFAKLFDTFLRGFDGPRLARWTKIFDPVPPSGESAEQVMDEPTFTWLRRRAEPYFGQDQARVAAEIFHQEGMHREALLAFRWTLAVDEPSDAVLSTLQSTLHELAAPEVTWAVAQWPRFSSPQRKLAAAQQEPCPWLADLPALDSLTQAQKALVQQATEAGLAQAAAAFAADHDSLAGRLGVAPLAITLEGDADALGHPFHQPEQMMAMQGWHEDGLTDHEERRVEGLWLVTDTGDVHVGRNELRTGTDTMDRQSHWRDAFVLADTWMEPGRYRVSMQIEQTTALFNGGVVLGYTRRDRQVRFSMSGGDVQFARGETAQREAGGAVSWTLDGLYSRGGRESGNISFASGSTTFALEFLVDGPTVTVFGQGKEIAQFTTLDAHPIQGRVGFFTSYGAMRVVSPSWARLDRERPAGLAGSEGQGLDPWLPGKNRLRELIGLPVNGVPLADPGTVILWFSEEKAEQIAEVGQEAWRERIEEQCLRLLKAWKVQLPAQGITIVLPQSLGEEQAAILRSNLEAEELLHPRGPLQWSWHGPKPELRESSMTVGGWTRPLLVFADPVGIARSARRMPTTGSAIPEEIFRLLEIYQDHSRPGMAGAAD